MTPPLLKLAFVQGPRDGESLEYKPGSTIRIGRVVRGNEIAIKDAGISTKHLRIVSDSENWIIHDLGSSNGTILNSETLDPDTPVNLRHGDVIKLGEYTSIVVSFETDVQVEVAEEEHKLPPRPRRNNRRLPVPDPDPVPVQEKPTRKGRSAKQEEDEPPKRSRATRSKKLEDIAENDKEPEVISRVGRPRKEEEAVAVEKKGNFRAQGGKKKNTVAVLEDIVHNEKEVEEEEAVAVEKEGNSRAQRGKKNSEDVQDLGLNSIKLEIEETPKEVEMSAMKRGTRSRQMRNVKCEDAVVEEKRRPSRATRSTKKEIGGDSFLELEMVLNQARKSRAKKKKTEQKPPESVVEARNEDVEDDKESENDKVERVETESRKRAIVGEENLSSSVGEDGETDNLQESKGEEGGVETSDGGCNDEEKAEQEESRSNKKVDLEKMTLGDWFKYMEVYLRQKIVDETEEMIEAMRAKSQRVNQYIAEQKQAQGKGGAT